MRWQHSDAILRIFERAVPKQAVLELHARMPCRTVQDNAVFVPYGESMDADMERIQYMRDMKGYCKMVMPRGLAVLEEDRGTLPDHLIEVRIP